MPTFFSGFQIEVFHLVGRVSLADIDDVTEAPVSPVIVVKLQEIKDLFLTLQDVWRIFWWQIGSRQLGKDEDPSEREPTSKLWV
jgi:hypothetical protein